MSTLRHITPQGCRLTPDKARTIARLMGDGAIYSSGTAYTLKYEVSDEELLSSFRSDISKIYGLKTKRYTNPSGKTGQPIPLEVIRSKEIFEDLQKFGPYSSWMWRVPKEIFASDRSTKKEFLQAFYDDEGSVIISNKDLRLYSVNLKGLKDIQKLLQGFNIESCIRERYGQRRNVYAVVLKRENILKFQEQINFSLQRKKVKLTKLCSSLAKDRSRRP